MNYWLKVLKMGCLVIICFSAALLYAVDASLPADAPVNEIWTKMHEAGMI